MPGVDSQLRITRPFLYRGELYRGESISAPAENPERSVRGLISRIRRLGSYPAIVLILPGGSLIALTLWIWRHRAWLASRARRGLAAMLAFWVGLIFPS
jgi:hypothetical protein